MELPRILKSKYRNIKTGIKLLLNSSNRLRLLSFINGTVLDNNSDISDELLKNVRFSLAKFDLSRNYPKTYRKCKEHLNSSKNKRII